MKESDWRKGILASDSTGVETDRYARVTAILDHLIILSTGLTSKKTHDSPVLRTMLNRLKKYGGKGKTSLTV